MKTKHTPRSLLAAVLVAAVSLVLMSATSSSSASSYSEAFPSSEIVDGMQSLGSVLVPATPDLRQQAAVDASEAIAEAQKYGAGNVAPTSVGLAVLTDTASRAIDLKTGDPYGPSLGVRDQPAYVVVFDGLELYPIGDPDAAPGSATIHHELIVLVDATTGEFISSTTFR